MLSLTTSSRRARQQPRSFCSAGAVRPIRSHAKAIDTYWICTAEHGLNASTFTARIVASTGADCGALALGGRRCALGAAARRGAGLRQADARGGGAVGRRRSAGSGTRSPPGKRIMGFGHRIYRAEDPRSRLLKRTAKELGSTQVELAEELEQVALAALQERHPERVLATNVEYYSAIVLDVAEIPPRLAPAMFACSRVAGWSAHILEQKRTGRLFRPSARYVGPATRSLQSVLLTLAEAAARGRRPRAAGLESASLRSCVRSGTRSSSQPRAARTTASAPLPTGRSGSFGLDRSSSCFAGASTTRARPAAARRCWRWSCSPATIRAISTRTARSLHKLVSDAEENPAVRRLADHVSEERLASARHDRDPRESRRRRRSRPRATSGRKAGRRAAEEEGR